MNEQEILLQKIKDETKSLIDGVTNGMVTKEELNQAIVKFTELQESVKEYPTQLAALKTGIDELSKSLALLSDSNKTAKVFETREKAIEYAVKELTENDEFKKWADSGAKGKCPVDIAVKYSIASSRTGNDTITANPGVVSDPYMIRPLHVRDLIPVMQSDFPYLVHDTVTSFTNPALGISETDDALEVTMTTSEVTTSYKRISIFMDITKSALKAVKWLQGHIVNKLPEKIKNHEDFQLLFGDGAGNNVDGIFKNATLLNLDGPSFSATAISSIATYQSGTKTIVNFAAEHGLLNGMIITFVGFTPSGYNAAHVVNVRTSKSIVIDYAYTADADVSDVTATSKYGLKNAINLATEVDCLNAAKAVMRVGEYMITAHVINPQDGAIIEGLKDTTGQYLGSKIERINGVLYVGGTPCIESNYMKQGWFLSADFRNLAELLEFIGLSVTFIEDTTYAKANKVMLLAEEQILFPIYNKFLATYGNFATVKTALETA